MKQHQNVEFKEENFKNPRLTSFRKQKLEFFFHESQATDSRRSRFGIAGSPKWIKYLVKFFNAPTVDEKIATIWLDKFLNFKLDPKNAATIGNEDNWKYKEYPVQWYTTMKHLRLKPPSKTVARARVNLNKKESTNPSLYTKWERNNSETEGVTYENYCEPTFKRFEVQSGSNYDSFIRNQVCQTLSKLEEPWMSLAEKNFQQTSDLELEHTTSTVENLHNTTATGTVCSEIAYVSVEENPGVIDYSMRKELNAAEKETEISSLMLPNERSPSFLQSNFSEQNDNARSQSTQYFQYEPSVADLVAASSEEYEVQQWRNTELDTSNYQFDQHPDVLQPTYYNNTLPIYPNGSSAASASLPWPYNMIRRVETQSQTFYGESDDHVAEITRTVEDFAVNDDHRGISNPEKFNVEIEGTNNDFSVNRYKNIKYEECKIYTAILKSACNGNDKLLRVILELETCIAILHE